MSRAFAYLRVSTPGQTTDNQLQEIRAAGFAIEPRRVVTETVSGSLATVRRPGFARLLDRLEPGDVLVVTKLDRLGRDAMDVGSTVARLADLGVRVHCLALGGVDLTSSTGKLTMGVINAVAEFERFRPASLGWQAATPSRRKRGPGSVRGGSGAARFRRGGERRPAPVSRDLEQLRLAAERIEPLPSVQRLRLGGEPLLQCPPTHDPAHRMFPSRPRRAHGNARPAVRVAPASEDRNDDRRRWAVGSPGVRR